MLVVESVWMHFQCTCEAAMGELRVRRLCD